MRAGGVMWEPCRARLVAPMDNQNRAIEEWAACRSAHDVERLLRLFSADVIYEDVPMGVINRGASELRAFGERVFSDLPDITFELHSSLTDGNRGSAEWVMRATRNLPGVPGRGNRIQVRGVSVFEFTGDKIRRCSDYWDMATYLKQLA
jgi:steroid delta-isomerase-like uncharacterized protein